MNGPLQELLVSKPLLDQRAIDQEMIKAQYLTLKSIQEFDKKEYVAVAVIFLTITLDDFKNRNAF